MNLKDHTVIALRISLLFKGKTNGRNEIQAGTTSTNDYFAKSSRTNEH